MWFCQHTRYVAGLLKRLRTDTNAHRSWEAECIALNSEASLVCHQDPHHSVRRQTAWTLSHFAQHLVPQILRYHEEVLPVVLRLLQDPQPRVVESSCYVIDCFCDEMSADNLRPFLSPLMDRLGGLLGTDDVKVDCNCLICSSPVPNFRSGARNGVVRCW